MALNSPSRPWSFRPRANGYRSRLDRRRRSLVRFEGALEPRLLLTSSVVDNTLDSGPGSLRQAIINANSDAGSDTITFNIPGAGVQTINLASPLPAIVYQATIDGTSQPGYVSAPRVEVNGAAAGAGADGFDFQGFNASGSILKGLSIYSFAGAGVSNDASASDLLIQSNYLGLKADGSLPPTRNVIGIDSVTDGNVFRGNVISGNSSSGIRIRALSSGANRGMNNQIVGNLIGLAPNGFDPMGNVGAGIAILNSNGAAFGPSQTTIGGTALADRNVIDNNSGGGIYIDGGGTGDNGGHLILNNYIGLTKPGTALYGNNDPGIVITGGSANNTIGGTGVGEGNVIGRNAFAGVTISSAPGTRVLGNTIGGTPGGDPAPSGVGVQVSGAGTTGTRIDSNVIMSNSGYGVDLTIGVTGAVVTGNRIGLNAAGASRGNGTGGVRIFGASGNTIGGTVAAARNIISGNTGDGISVEGIASTANLVIGNYIGTDPAGLAAVPNSQHGIQITGGAKYNTIGGPNPGEGNILSGNAVDGVHIDGVSSTGNVVLGNLVGVGADGLGHGPGSVAWYRAESNANDSSEASPKQNGTLGAGVSIVPGQVGQAFSFTGAADSGVSITGSTSGPLNLTGTEMAIEGWVYQTDPTQTNNPWGIQTIFGKWFGGGSASGYLLQTANGVLSLSIATSGNARRDVYAPSALPLNTWVHVAFTYDGSTARLFQNGVQVASSALSGTILTSPNEAALGNNLPGTSGWKGRIDELTVYKRTLDVAELQAIVAAGTAGKANILGNGNEGIEVDTAPGTTIGGTAAGAGNVISGSRNGSGLWFHSDGTARNMAAVVLGNKIGTTADGSAPAPNMHSGITVSNGATNVTIGGATSTPGSGAGNLISGNHFTGIYSDSAQTLIQGNRIGLQGNAELAMGNTAHGVDLRGANNTVGGSVAGTRNVIAASGYEGINILGVGATGNSILGNYIGTNATGSDAVPNSHGILISAGAHHNTIGGLTATPGDGPGNLISGNRIDGILLMDAGTNFNVIQGNLIGVDATGSYAVRNLSSGVAAIIGASGNTIGGAVAGAGNLLGGNDSAVFLGDYGSSATAAVANNLVAGNVMGLNLAGTGRIANNRGVWAINTARNNTIGGTSAAARNIISGNTYQGIWVQYAGASGNLVQGNYVGTDAAGNALDPSTAAWFQAENNTTDSIGGLAGSVNAGVGFTPGEVGQAFNFDGTSGTVAVPSSAALEPSRVSFEGWIKASSAQANKYLMVKGTNATGGFSYALRTNAAGRLIGSVSDGTTTLNTPAAPVSIWDGAYHHVAVIWAGNNLQLLVDGVDYGSGFQTLTINYALTDRNFYLGSYGGASGFWAGEIDELAIHNAAISTGQAISVFKAGSTGKLGALTGNRGSGIEVDRAVNTTIGGTAAGAGNVVGGNFFVGVFVQAGGVAQSTPTLIQGNMIGVNPAGVAAVPNKSAGVAVVDGAADVTIGGTSAAARNVISGNMYAGVTVQRYATSTSPTRVTVQGNYIGTDATGNALLGNAESGVYVFAPGNTIGGTVAGAGNIISGNRYVGVGFNSLATSNLIAGNLIGLGADGGTVLPNRYQGIDLNGSGNTVGGTVAAARNVISGNVGGYGGVKIIGSNQLVIGNYIGLTADGTAARGNSWYGISVGATGSATNSTIGGTTAAERNVIAGNTGPGVFIGGTGTSGIVVQGNSIGTDATGAIDLGNTSDGVKVDNATRNNTIGGSAAGAGNLISGNNGFGVQINNSERIVVAGNFIGTDAAGTADLGNTSTGVRITGNSRDNTIGGGTASARNVIAGNDQDGVALDGASVFFNLVAGNYIGTDAAGAVRLGNTYRNVALYNGAHNNTIGGITATAGTGLGNVIGGTLNWENVHISGGSVSNVIAGNIIGLDKDGAVGLSSPGAGVYIAGGTANTIGGTAAGAGNVISGHAAEGVRLVGGGTIGNVVQGNRIGTNRDGTASMGVQKRGFLIDAGAADNTIGGATPGAGNLVSGNVWEGLAIHSGATRNLVAGNWIGLNAAGTAALKNSTGGIWIADAPNNTIGGSTTTPGTGYGNVISGNQNAGILITVSTGSSAGNVIAGNIIGLNPAGTAKVANSTFGVDVVASGVTVGGTAAGARNVVSGNNSMGIQVRGTTTTSVLVTGNFVGTNPAGTAALGNGFHGIRVFQADGNTVSSNVVSGNLHDGIAISGGADNNLIVGNYAGTDFTGMLAIGNDSGLSVLNGANNTIRGNVSSGNNVGFYMENAASTGNVLKGNWIGPAADGSALGNNQAGVYITIGAHDNTIGGAATSDGNTIAYNTGPGVAVDSTAGAGNMIRRNSIHTNTGLGIDRGDSGSTPNDADDADAIQNFPVLDLALTYTTRIVVSGTLNTALGRSGVLEFFASPTALGGEGQVFLGDVAFSAAVSNTVNFIASLPIATTVPDGWYVTATATGADTSEFSAVEIKRSAFLVTNTLDAGAPDHSLRWAMQNANSEPGLDTIRFDIPGAGVQIIQPGSALPTVADPVVIDGASQPGYAGTPLIELDGQNAGANVAGLTITAADSTIRALAISAFSGGGVLLSGTGASRNQVVGSVIGLHADGTTPAPNGGSGVLIDGGSDNTIGGLTATPGTGLGNVISANAESGVKITTVDASANVVAGNLIGTDRAGGAARPNAAGVTISDEAHDNTIGGVSVLARNVVSGNTDAGVALVRGASANVVAGNFIGADAAGFAALSNDIGVSINDSSHDNQIGVPTAGNLIAGNQNAGVAVSDLAANNRIRSNSIGTTAAGAAALEPNPAVAQIGILLDNSMSSTVGGTAAGEGNLISGNSVGVQVHSEAVIQGNFIGTDSTGMLPVPNLVGIAVDLAVGVQIGGTDPYARNVISGNQDVGLSLGDAATGTLVQGNFIGTDRLGTGALGNGDPQGGSLSQDAGILITGDNNTIGGAAGGARNLIGGNLVGVLVMGSTTAAAGNVIQGNFIGADVNGTASLGNHRHGVELRFALGTTIGGDAPGAGNLIAHNGLQGSLAGVAVTLGTRNTIRGNRFADNTGLGIDLGGDGVTPNDADDSDGGPNNLQNFPVLASVDSDDGETTFLGSLTSTPDQTYTIDFYSAPAADPSGYGEGRTYLGSALVATGSNGQADFSVSLSLDLTDHQYITATATDDLGSTSEFGPSYEFSPGGQPNRPPVAVATAGATTPDEGESVQFDGAGSTDPDGDPLSYFWDFGDGSTSTAAAPSHVFDHAGTYTVTLRVNDGFTPLADQPTATLTVIVQNAAPALSSGAYALSRVFTNPQGVGVSFGASMAAVGDSLAVAAPSARADAVGFVSLFYNDPDPGSPTFGQVLRIDLADPSGSPGSGFGTAMVSLGGVLAVGAPGVRRVYLFGAAPGTSVFGQLVGSYGRAGDDGFGAALSSVGTDFLVGAPQADGGGRVFRFSPSSGSSDPTTVYMNPSGDSAAAFGASLAARGADVIVGAPGEASETGAAYLFVNGDPTPQALSPSASPQAGDRFGAAVAAVGAQIAVGAPGDTGAGPNAGAVFTFGSGGLPARLTTPFDAGGRFGATLAGSPLSLLVGAPEAGLGAAGAGAAYLFDAGSGLLRMAAQTPLPVSGAGNGRAVAFLQDDLVVAAEGRAAYFITGQGALGRSEDDLTADGPGLGLSSGEVFETAHGLQSVILHGSVTDATPDDAHTVEVDWGDGSTTSTLTLPPGRLSFVLAHRYVQDAPQARTILATVKDNAGATARGSIQVLVHNSPPVPSAGADRSVVEGETVSFTGVFTDTGEVDNHTYLWTVTADNGDEIAPATTQGFSFVPGRPGRYVVTYQVADGDGGLGVSSAVVTATNTPPRLTGLSADRTQVNEGESVHLSGTFTDATDAVPHTVTITWGDPDAADSSQPATTLLNIPAGVFTFSADHVYVDDNRDGYADGGYPVSVVVGDGEDSSDSSSYPLTIGVANVAPVARISSVQGANLNTGRIYLTGNTSTDPGGAYDPLSYQWTITGYDANGDPTTYGADGQPTTPGAVAGTGVDFDFTPPTVGYTVGLVVDDGDGGQGQAVTALLAGSPVSETISVQDSLATLPPTTQISQVVVLGYGGDDTIDATGLTVPIVADGGDGNDSIQGGGGNDTVFGGSGNDTAFGGAGDDTLMGHQEGEHGDQTLFGGSGNDTYQITFRSNIVIGELDTGLNNDGDPSGGGGEGGPIDSGGLDVINLTNNPTGVAIRLDTDSQQNVDGSNFVTILGSKYFEGLVGSIYDDVLTGNTLDNQLSGGTGNDVLFGGDGGDVLDGGDDDDTIYTMPNPITVPGGSGLPTPTTTTPSTLRGGLGNDVLFGGDKGDILDGGIGNDTVHGGAGNTTTLPGGSLPAPSTLTGGLGNDVLFGGDKGDVLDGGDDDDTIYTAPTLPGGTTTQPVIQPTTRPATVVGGAGNDVLFGGDKGDVLDGGTGHDTVYGGSGVPSPTVSGGGGTTLPPSTIRGGLGNDVLFGGDKGDVLDGGDDQDTIYAGGGDTTAPVITLPGGATLPGGSKGTTSPATIIGGLGNDVLFGGDKGDVLDGGDGHDTVYGGSGTPTMPGGGTTLPPSTIRGGLGNDVLFGGDKGDVLDGGDDQDTIYAGGGDTTAPPITLPGGMTLPGGSKGTTTPATIIGGAGNDVLFGGDKGDVLDGGDGHDTVYGGSSTPTMPGGGTTPPPSTIRGGLGNDVLFGGDKGDVLDGGDDHDTIYAGGGDTTAPVITMPGGMTLPGGSKGTTTPATITGGAGNDVLFGGDKGDVLDGGSGHDTVYGGSSTPTMPGGGTTPPPSTIRGGLGNDVLFGGDKGDVLDGGDDHDTIYAGGGDTTAPVITLPGGMTLPGGSKGTTNPATLTGGAGNDVLFGGDKGDVLDGGTGHDTIYGGSNLPTMPGGGPATPPPSTIRGGAGNDVLFGGDKGDALDGGDGDDVISTAPPTGGGTTSPATVTGGAGNDVLFGGDKGDVLDGGSGHDTIYGGSNMPAPPSGGDGVITPPPPSTIRGGLGNDVLFGGDATAMVEGEDGDDLLIVNGGLGTFDGGAGNDLLYKAANLSMTLTSIPPSGDGNDAMLDLFDLNGVPLGRTMLSGFEQARLVGGPGANVLDASGFKGAVFLQGAGGDDQLIGGAFDDILEGGAGDDTARGGGGNDIYRFGPGVLGADTVEELPGGGQHDQLEFSFFSGPARVDLRQSGPQVVNPALLTLTLVTPDAFEDLAGSPYDDVLLGNNSGNDLRGAGGYDTLAGFAGDDLLIGGATQVVYLDFDTYANTELRPYAPREQDAIQRRLAADFSTFNITFTQSRPSSGRYTTLRFNDPRLSGLEGGVSDAIDWRNLVDSDSASINVQGLLGRVGQPQATGGNIVAMTATVAAHELVHLLGGLHSDAFGPPGFGIFAGIKPDAFSPSYPELGPRLADETPLHIIASPASMRTSLFDALGDVFLGEREAIKLAYADHGSPLFEPAGAHEALDETAPLVALTPLAVPNPVLVGRNAGKTLDVRAVDMIGSIDARPDGSAETDVYRFAGVKNQVMTLEVLSNSLARNRGSSRAIDTVVRVYGSDGQLVPYYGSTAVNDNGLDTRDSILVDLVLPADGDYYVQVGAADTADTGDYELFLYTVADGSNQGGGDVIYAGTGENRIVGGPSNDIYYADLKSTTIVYGSGRAQVIGNAPPESLAIQADRTDPTEGDSVNLSGSYIDFDDGQTHTLSWHVVADNGETFVGSGANFLFTPGGAGDYTVTFSVDDGGGAVQTQSTITVGNAPPVLTAPADGAATEGTAAAISVGSLGDPGSLDGPWQIEVDWGDGSSSTTFAADSLGDLGTQAHTYHADGTYTVTVRAADRLGATADPVSFPVVVANGEPVVQTGGDETITSARFTRTGSFTDPGDDSPWMAWARYGDDGAYIPLTVDPTSRTFTLDHTYSASGNYTVTVLVTDQGGMTGAGAFVVAVNLPPSDVDTLAPSSQIVSAVLDQTGEVPSVVITVTATDTAPEGATPSGVASFDVYYTLDNTTYTAIAANLPAGTPDALGRSTAVTSFTPQSNVIYGFRVIARDAAGNVEAKATAAEVTLALGDVDRPVTRATDSTALLASPDGVFQVNWTGADAGGSYLSTVDIYVVVDHRAPLKIDTVPAGKAVGGVYGGSVFYQAQPGTHTYRFYTIGADNHGNREPKPASATADQVFSNVAFTTPAAVAVDAFRVQKGLAGRSFVRYVDVLLNNRAATTAIVKSMKDTNNSIPNRMELVRYDLDGVSNPTVVPIAASRVKAVDAAIALDFGATGITGKSTSNAGDGYYELKLDLDGDGTLETSRTFFRLLGDTQGDGVVDDQDVSAVAEDVLVFLKGNGLPTDINGDSKVNSIDRTLATNQKKLNRRLLGTRDING